MLQFSTVRPRELPPGVPTAGEYIGYRRWRLVHRPRAGWTLCSLYSTMVWKPGRIAQAFCPVQLRGGTLDKICPTFRGYHNCGIWACETRDGLDEQRQISSNIVEGLVRLHDQLYVHGDTARALHCEITAFFLDSIRCDDRNGALGLLAHFRVPLL